ncbi:MAG: response regulator [Prolixibacteraceae bacterium]|nr:response regulator [Prolixibacteraceae bacterium]
MKKTLFFILLSILMLHSNAKEAYIIGVKDLPLDSILINNPVSFVKHNTGILVYIFIFTIILSIALFIILMRSWMKITARKKYEKELEEENNKYETINKEYQALNKKLNITNNKLYIEKGKVEKANKLTHEFLHNMSHEIRTPMNGIIGFADMLKTDDLNEDQRTRYISIINSSCQQLLHVIDDILEISRLDIKKVPVFEEDICLNTLIAELFSVFKLKIKELNIDFRIKKELPDNDSYINTDKVKLLKILSNLLENAIKFTSEGFIELGYYIENNNLVIYVKGKGTTFYVTIPYKPLHKTANTIVNKTAIKKETIKNKLSRTILIAEDEEINFLYLKELLNYIDDYNLNILLAKNGEEAVNLCHENDVDVILMDIKMPVMNGIEASKKIKAFKPDVPIIVQTAYSMAEDKDLALKSGCDDFVSKPIDKDIFLSVLNKYLKLS